jgi:hypothetical protein
LYEADQRRANARTLKAWSHDHIYESCVIKTIPDGTRYADELTAVERESTRNATLKGDAKLVR